MSLARKCDYCGALIEHTPKESWLFPMEHGFYNWQAEIVLRPDTYSKINDGKGPDACAKCFEGFVVAALKERPVPE